MASCYIHYGELLCWEVSRSIGLVKDFRCLGLDKPGQSGVLALLDVRPTVVQDGHSGSAWLFISLSTSDKLVGAQPFLNVLEVLVMIKQRKLTAYQKQSAVGIVTLHCFLISTSITWEEEKEMGFIE